MGYPAPDIIEGIYRNRLEDVYKFMEENHGGHYRIYNLCQERSYDINKFHGVEYTKLKYSSYIQIYLFTECCNIPVRRSQSSSHCTDTTFLSRR